MNYNPILPKGQSCVHIIVVWHSAMSKKDEIINDLNKDFQVIKVFRGHWDADKFLENYLIFYAHSQKHRKYLDYRRILINKINLCKKGDFEVIVFRDTTPVFEERKTTSGVRYVNTRVFDKKQLYRKLTGGGSRVHGSDDAWETNKDLTIMFGKNTADFCSLYEEGRDLKPCDNEWTEDSFSHNCIGVDGYKDIQELFYVLNNTMEYVVLRNHEPIPNEYRVEGHGDIDLLVENRNYAAYLTGAIPVYPQSYRVYHHIKIGNQIIPFDFRAVYDNYYDCMWQVDILRSRVFTKNLFYVPNPEHQFYSLLYHAYVQKKFVKDDYHPKLSAYGYAIGVNYTPDVPTSFQLLDAFMLRHNYEYIRPKDKTVVFNYNNLQRSNHFNRYGECIKRNHIEGHVIDFDTIAYRKNNSFVKRGSKWLVENEYKSLSLLSGYHYFPKVIDYRVISDQESVIEISKMPGVTPTEFFSQYGNYNKKFVTSYVSNAIAIMAVLAKEGIMHRDLYHDNFLIHIESDSLQLSLIDFGWATSYEDKDAPISPFVCRRYSSEDNKYDLIEFANQLSLSWSLSPYCMSISKKLKHIAKDNNDPNAVARQLVDLSSKAVEGFGLADYLVFKVIYTIKDNEFISRVFKNRTFQVVRNRKGALGKIFSILEYIKIRIRK